MCPPLPQYLGPQRKYCFFSTLFAAKDIFEAGHDWVVHHFVWLSGWLATHSHLFCTSKLLLLLLSLECEREAWLCGGESDALWWCMLGRPRINIRVGTAKAWWSVSRRAMVTCMAASAPWNSHLFSLVIVIVSRCCSYLPSGARWWIPAQGWIQAIAELVTNGASVDALTNHTRCSCCFCSSSARVRRMVVVKLTWATWAHS